MTDYQAVARQAAMSAGIDPNIFIKQIQQESGFNPNVVSPAGAIGIAQFMPTTAAGMGVNPRDPVASLNAAAQLDARNLKTYGGSYPKALAAYNAGSGTVNNAVTRGGADWLSFTPLETQNYVQAIVGSTTPSTTGASTGGPLDSVTNILKAWGEYIAIFSIALILIILGFYLLAQKQTTQAVKNVGKLVS